MIWCLNDKKLHICQAERIVLFQEIKDNFKIKFLFCKKNPLKQSFANTVDEGRTGYQYFLRM